MQGVYHISSAVPEIGSMLFWGSVVLYSERGSDLWRAPSIHALSFLCRLSKESILRRRIASAQDGPT